MALSALALAKAKPREKLYELADGHGLVTPQGGRYWRMNYRFDGKAKTGRSASRPVASP
ncbi:Arm DNA-binding domain-containing protein [Sphingomonas bisphenolicum]|nr:Arm DNA-binding domain-containing protein [Sphingomonas bisphenolicum]